MAQLTHYSNKFKKHSFPITLVCDNVSNSLNIGSLFRTADAFGVSQLILCGQHIEINNKVLRTSRSTEKYIRFSIEEDAHKVVRRLKNDRQTIVALEITQKSEPIHKIKLEKDKPLTLIIGDENFGISEQILAQVDKTYHIEMFGQNSSMNVVQATNIALYEITKQLM